MTYQGKLELTYENLLELPRGWHINSVNQDDKNQKVTVSIGYDEILCKCPAKGCISEAKFHDKQFRRVRDIDFNQHQTFLDINFFRLRCPVHGIQTIDPPFITTSSRFTSNFEKYVWKLCREKDSTIQNVAKHLGLTWHTVHELQYRAFRHSVTRQEKNWSYKNSINSWLRKEERHKIIENVKRYYSSNKAVMKLLFYANTSFRILFFRDALENGFTIKQITNSSLISPVMPIPECEHFPLRLQIKILKSIIQDFIDNNPKYFIKYQYRNSERYTITDLLIYDFFKFLKLNIIKELHRIFYPDFRILLKYLTSYDIFIWLIENIYYPLAKNDNHSFNLKKITIEFKEKYWKKELPYINKNHNSTRIINSGKTSDARLRF